VYENALGFWDNASCVISIGNMSVADYALKEFKVRRE